MNGFGRTVFGAGAAGSVVGIHNTVFFHKGGLTQLDRLLFLNGDLFNSTCRAGFAAARAAGAGRGESAAVPAPGQDGGR